MLAGARAFLIALALVTLAPRARAEVAIAPAENGQLGVFLVAGALSEARCKALAPGNVLPAKGARLESAEFRLLFEKRGALDLERLLGAGNRSGPCAVAGAMLVVQQRFEGFLLVSADGPLGVWVAGQRLFSEPDKQLRGSSWEALPLRLEPGRHALVIHTTHPGDHWALSARLLDAARLLPPAHVRWTLPGTELADAEKLAAGLVTLNVDAGLDAASYRPRLTLSFENGAPRELALPAKVELASGGKRLLGFELGSIAVGARAVHPLEAQLPPLSSSALSSSDAPVRLRARASVGPARAERDLVVAQRAPAVIAEAERVQARLGAKPAAGFIDASAVGATLAWRSRRLSELAVLDPPQPARLAAELRALDALLAAIAGGKDPLLTPGLIDIARISPLDARPEPLLLHVPASLATDRKALRPLVVVLHGYRGTPASVMSAFLDAPESARQPKLDGFVLAPNAHGDAFYRGPGEHEVLSAIDWVVEKYPIDRDRVSITGVSMGGTGSAFVALRHADRFSALSPLCGYHSYFVRRDTSKRPIRPWETERMHHWSPASWAESGRNLPLWVAHGTKDWPLENSRVLIERYRALGYAVTDEWPDTGHSVWEKTWAGARMWPWLTRQKRQRDPKRVTLRSNALATAKLGFARIVRLARPGHMGTLDVEIESPTAIRATASEVSAFALERTQLVANDQPITLAVAGSKLTFVPGEPLAASLRADGWAKGASEPGKGEKRAGVEGPIRAVFDGPLAFVWGSGDPRTARANREVAEAFARTRHGPGIEYRVIADVELDPATEKTHALFVVGTAADHRWLAAAGGAFPIRAHGGTLTLGPHSLGQPGSGAIFVHPNPRHPSRQVVVVTGLDAAGIWRALSLPALLPDFLVYDARMSPASNEQVLGKAEVAFGGFFDQAWRLPADARDPGAKP